MKLVSFQVQTPVGNFVRAGALHGRSIVDLNMACARLLADQHEAQAGSPRTDHPSPYPPDRGGSLDRSRHAPPC